MRRNPYALAAVAIVLICVLLLVVSCSSEPSQGQTSGDQRSGESRGAAADGSQPQPEGTDETPEDASQPGTERPLVPIAHLTSKREGVSKEELSQNRELAVPQATMDLAKDLLGGSGFRGFGSAGAVVDHVSRYPEALGLVPWDEVGPRV